MAKQPAKIIKKSRKDESDQGPIAFDEALRRMVNAPPQHKTAKKRYGKTTGDDGK